MIQKTLFKTALILSFLALAACTSTVVQRVNLDTQADLSGRWNDTDSRSVAETMVEDVLNAIWLKDYMDKNNSQPVAIVGDVVNRSDEHINTAAFVKDLERSLINSGKVEFVASRAEREQLREERQDQSLYSSENTAKHEGEEIGADFMLKGSINTITDRIEGKMVKYYQVNLELINIETHRKAWIGEKKIKKIVEQSRFGF